MRNGIICGIGKAGNPDVMDNVHPDLVIGSSTEVIAGVKDMRFQALMPDILHWLGITKIDNMVSMSDMYVFHSLATTAFSTDDPSASQEIQRDCPVWHSNPQAIRHPWYVVLHEMPHE